MSGIFLEYGVEIGTAKAESADSRSPRILASSMYPRPSFGIDVKRAASESGVWIRNGDAY